MMLPSLIGWPYDASLDTTLGETRGKITSVTTAGLVVIVIGKYFTKSIHSGTAWASDGNDTPGLRPTHQGPVAL